MNRHHLLFWLLVLNISYFAQDVEYLGLSSKHLTSLKIGYGILSVGTKYNGVYWQQEGSVSDTGWYKIDIDSVNVRAVYPHKSGPLGWAIGVGAEPDLNNRELIFCSFLGETPKPMSYGIDTNTFAITGIDGFPDPTICGETFAIGDRKLYRRYFQDTIWHPIYNLSFEGYFAAIKARENNQYVYAGGAEGWAGILLIRSSNKGESWDDLFPSCMVMDLDFYGDTIHKIIVTDHFKIMLSTDSGDNWREIFRTDSLGIQNIAFSNDGQKIYVVTNTMYYDFPRTYFFYNSDEGKTWESLQLPIYDIIADMDLDFNDDIYLASISSGVFRLKSPVVSVKDETENVFPKDFILYQNYPNPFNPTTKIKFEIPTSPLNPSPYQGEENRERLVTLKVYDILGNEVATLVNEYKLARSYEVEFNGSKLASGIFYYQLRVGKFIQTKKMILLK
jgi:hypothetical protein